MSTPVKRSAGRVALIALVALALSGCTPILFTGGGGGGATGAACLPGTWTLDSETITAPISALIPGLQITTAGPGVTVTFDGTHWALHADQTLNGTLTTPLGSASGTAHVTADANGTYTATDSAITFTLAGVTGSVAYSVTFAGQTYSGTLSLPTSGLQQLYGLTGTANYTCGSSGLSLQFSGFSMHAHD